MNAMPLPHCPHQRGLETIGDDTEDQQDAAFEWLLQHASASAIPWRTAETVGLIMGRAELLAMFEGWLQAKHDNFADLAEIARRMQE